MNDFTDLDRRDFLDALDFAPFSVTDWEMEFIDDTKNKIKFSPGQREAIDRMIERYDDRLNW